MIEICLNPDSEIVGECCLTYNNMLFNINTTYVVCKSFCVFCNVSLLFFYVGGETFELSEGSDRYIYVLCQYPLV